ncbi:MAG: hypothetical protein QOE33_3787 [Acidobacteriota bacterium]|nr:hypothetical protein [Acidobacteriota bacterium]
MPADRPDGVRHVDDASLICCFCVEREKACLDTAHLVEGEREGVSQAAETARD